MIFWWINQTETFKTRGTKIAVIPRQSECFELLIYCFVFWMIYRNSWNVFYVHKWISSSIFVSPCAQQIRETVERVSVSRGWWGKSFGLYRKPVKTELENKQEVSDGFQVLFASVGRKRSRVPQSLQHMVELLESCWAIDMQEEECQWLLEEVTGSTHSVFNW